jgi:hypothetical protein
MKMHRLGSCSDSAASFGGKLLRRPRRSGMDPIAVQCCLQENSVVHRRRLADDPSSHASRHAARRHHRTKPIVAALPILMAVD